MILDLGRTWGQARSPSEARAWWDGLDHDDRVELWALHRIDREQSAPPKAAAPARPPAGGRR